MASKAKRSTTTGKRAATRKSTAAAKPARMNKTDLIEPPRARRHTHGAAEEQSPQIQAR